MNFPKVRLIFPFVVCVCLAGQEGQAAGELFQNSNDSSAIPSDPQLMPVEHLSFSEIIKYLSDIKTAKEIIADEICKAKNLGNVEMMECQSCLDKITTILEEETPLAKLLWIAAQEKFVAKNRENLGMAEWLSLLKKIDEAFRMEGFSARLLWLNGQDRKRLEKSLSPKFGEKVLSSKEQEDVKRRISELNEKIKMGYNLLCKHVQIELLDKIQSRSSSSAKKSNKLCYSQGSLLPLSFWEIIKKNIAKRREARRGASNSPQPFPLIPMIYLK
jgi:hypothetical protein